MVSGNGGHLREGEERVVRNEVSLSEALERVFESSQRALLARIDLLRLEAEEDLSRTFWSLAFIAAGGVFALCGWFVLMGLAVRALDGVLPLVASLGVVGGLNALIGSALLAIGIQSIRRLRLMRPDDVPENRRWNEDPRE